MLVQEISTQLQAGNAKMVKELIPQALEEGISAEQILKEGLMDGMDIIGQKFRNNEIFVPQVMLSARAMKQGADLLKPYLVQDDVKPLGKICLGTVLGDLHDIGKNLVKMMLEGKGFEVIDIGTNAPAQDFIDTAINEGCSIIACSALLTSTMPVMEDVVKAAEAAGIRDKVKIMIGGAPVNEGFRQKIGADYYAVDAASAAEAAVELVQNI